MMQIADPSQTTVCNEVRLMLDTLPFRDARVLELGCGRADKTRTLAASGLPREIVALEVDARQHARNQADNTDPRIDFRMGGAEAIPLADDSVDIVIMLKSLHHVPLARMSAALHEIARVLRPGGWAWISEPVYAGDLNEIMRLFHDEQVVRAAAFAVTRQAVDAGILQLAEQRFFLTRSHFDSFAEFEQRMINVTHSDHQLSPECHVAVCARFSAHLTSEGATFLNPQRVDLLRKPV